MLSVVKSAKKIPVCHTADLVKNSGVCALIEGEQIALFYLPATEKKVYAISNRDPFGDANVLSRGIVGDLDGKLVVASPLLKQHFDLETGECTEDAEKSISAFEAELIDDQVYLTLNQ